MYPYALIVAALSASALASVSLTAYDHTDSTCTGTAIGNHIGLPGSQCKLYQPEQSDAYIKAVWLSGAVYHNITMFSDTNCENVIANIGVSDATFKAAGHSDCYSMGTIAGGPWGSARVGGWTH